MTKQEIADKEIEISQMDSVEAEKFNMTVHNSMLDSSIKRILLRAVEIRREELVVDLESAIAVESEIEED